MAAERPKALGEALRAVPCALTCCPAIVVDVLTVRPDFGTRNASCSFPKPQVSSREGLSMPEDVPNVAELREESSGGRSSVAGYVASRQRNPKRSLRVQGQSSPYTPLPKRPSARPKGAPVKGSPSEETLNEEAEFETEKARRELRDSWRRSSEVLQGCADDFEETLEAGRREVLRNEVKTVTEALEGAQLEDLQEETTEVDIKAESDDEGASLRQHRNETGED